MVADTAEARMACLGYGVGATLRGSLGAVSHALRESSATRPTARGSDADTGEREGGVTVGFGYEARRRLDELDSNAIILAAVVSYERMNDSNSGAHYNLLDPRAKVGYAARLRAPASVSKMAPRSRSLSTLRVALLP